MNDILNEQGLVAAADTSLDATLDQMLADVDTVEATEPAGPNPFEELGLAPELVLRGFIADLCEIMSWAADPRTDGYCSNGSDERSMAMDYYRRVGYPWWNKG